MADNFERMMQLVTDFFDTRNDPDQISVTEEERDKLAAIHPDTLSELANDDGPIVWILLVPTTKSIMDLFLRGEISEKQLLVLTPSGVPYESIYLCSASVLPEFRQQGLAKKVAVGSIDKIGKDHPITSLFYWPLSEEGKSLARSISSATRLELFEKE